MGTQSCSYCCLQADGEAPAGGYNAVDFKHLNVSDEVRLALDDLCNTICKVLFVCHWFKRAWATWY